MSSDDLVRMSRQIAEFFEPYPREEAVAGVQEHLVKFWTPTMRAELFALRRGDHRELHPIVTEAVDRLLPGART
jgi:formate dehydrogenase subunit delta